LVVEGHLCHLHRVLLLDIAEQIGCFTGVGQALSKGIRALLQYLDPVFQICSMIENIAADL
jgi:hypothetical protein